MNRQLKIYKVNSLTNGSTGGSPTGVVLNADGLSDIQMQSITKRSSASHTGFVFEPAEAGKNLRVRFFTPGGEIRNCGHGTIAVHYVRAKMLGIKSNHLLFQEAKEGIQQVEITMEGDDLAVYLKQNPIQFAAVDNVTLKNLLSALNINSNHLENEFPPILASPGSYRFLLCLRSAETVNQLKPDLDQLKSLCRDINSMGCFVYSMNSWKPEITVTARMFAPMIGLNEDIINGNSSGCLGAYLLQQKGGDHLELKVHQGQKFGLDGVVKVKVKKNQDQFETIIGGSARIEEEEIITLDLPFTER